jgi:hypothetical protein
VISAEPAVFAELVWEDSRSVVLHRTVASSIFKVNVDLGGACIQ